jgi:flavin reductase (DIM6/NTAB) family NADH-FMN oxidoreductase RutF
MTTSAVEVAVSEATNLRRTFSCFPTGVACIAGLVDGDPQGLLVNSLTSVSLDPPLAAFCVAHTSRTWPLLGTADPIGVSVLTERQRNVGERFASTAAARFDQQDWDIHDDGALVLRDAAAWLACAVHSTMDAGDHRIVVLRILRHSGDPALRPLVFHASSYCTLES